MTVSGFRKGQLDEASKEYLAVEKQIGGSESEDAVLVSVDSVASLHRAYPNYFLDMAVFSDLIDEMVGKKET